MTTPHEPKRTGQEKRPYHRPKLTEYGSVAKLTRTGAGTILEGSSPNKMMM
ncbi:MAG: lasso RiPP family leader peptide-containing protein [Vicinamibacterales bacterium]